MTPPRRRLAAAVLLSAAVTRVPLWSSYSSVFPPDVRVVDESEYSRGSAALVAGEPFARPPLMYLLAAVVLPLGNSGARAAMSAISCLPALMAAGWASRRREALAAVLLAVDPFLAVSGMQMMPEAPAAALAALAVLLRARSRRFWSGVAVGAACLFRAELLLVPLLQSLRRDWRDASLLGAGLAVSPAVAWNLSCGSGPVISANGAENAWLGTSPELLRVPPGTEFEQLVALDGEGFAERAVDSLVSDPCRVILFSLRKASAAACIPGPGRNIEMDVLLGRTGLSFLLPVTALAVAMALAAERSRPWALALPALMISFAVFLPAARYRTAFLPMIYAAAATASPGRLRTVAGAALVALSSAFPPALVRPGLNSVIRAGGELDRGDPAAAEAYLAMARRAGFTGSDLHNLSGIAVAMRGDAAAALAEFEQALAIAPRSPTLWRNYAVALASAGRTQDSRAAAARAAALRPGLAEELYPLLGDAR